MATIFRSPIEEQVDRLFHEIKAKAKNRDFCINPVTGGQFIWGLDPIAPQKRAAVVALRAREWFAVEGGPLGAPPLPLSSNDVEDYRAARGLTGIVGFFARSLRREGYGRRRYDVCNHPSFNDFACGLMAIDLGIWGSETEDLKRRFPPRPLAGMTPGAYWAPPEEYERIMASYCKEQRRAA
jgi:hypothetical protein